MTLKHLYKGNRQTLWRSRAHSAWFRLCAVCLSVYAAYAVYFANSAFLKGTFQSLLAVLCFALLSAGLYVLLTQLCVRTAHRGPALRKMREHMDWRVFGLAFLLAMAVFGSAFAACYPGGVNYDISNQWRQVRSGEFNNWHPLLHTLLIWLITRIKDSYPLVLCVQITAFAAALAWLVATLYRHGIPAWVLLAAEGIAAASLPVRNALMYVGKDSAMTIGVLLLTAQTIRIVFSRGQWLRKWQNAVGMGIVLAYVMLIRINAMFYVIPLLLCLVFTWKAARKPAVLAAAVMAAVMAVVQGPVFGLLDVVYPSNLVEESIGLPMTVLGDIKQREPEKLDEETSAFLATLAPDEAWQNTYRLNSYNSIKFTFAREWISHTPVTDILRMSARSAAAAPRTAFEAVNGLTDLVWGVTGEDEGYSSVRNSGNLADVVGGHSELNALGEAACLVMDTITDFAPLRWLTRNVGVQQLLWLLAALWALCRRGTSALTLVLPALLYNMGTMLLLCGNDARFFQFTMTIALLSIAALIYLPEEEEGCR